MNKMKLIFLFKTHKDEGIRSQGIMVDNEDYPRIIASLQSGDKWYYAKKQSPRRFLPKEGEEYVEYLNGKIIKAQPLTHYILKVPYRQGIRVSFKDGNVYNHQKENLKITHSVFSKGKFARDNKVTYMSVTKQKARLNTWLREED